MPSRGPVLVGLAALLILPSLSGCLVGSAQRAVTISKQVDPDRDGEHDWLEVRLKTIEAPPPTGTDLAARVNGPAGAVTEQLCQSPELVDGSVCLEPLEAGEAWNPGTAVYLPCVEPGVNRFSIGFERGLILEESHGCGETAFASR